MDYLLLYCALLFIACAIRGSSSFLNNSTYIYDTYCADKKEGREEEGREGKREGKTTSWMWNKTTCESQWLNKTDSDIGKIIFYSFI